MPDGQVGLQPDRQLVAARVGDVAVVCRPSTRAGRARSRRPVRRSAPSRPRPRGTSQPARACASASSSVGGRVCGVTCPRRGAGRGQRVAHEHPAGRRLPRRQQHVRPRLVDARGGHVDPERPEAERARLAVEQRAEHARRVEARDAQPVDRPVGRDQRARVAVRQERVVGDRRERRGASPRSAASPDAVAAISAGVGARRCAAVLRDRSCAAFSRSRPSSRAPARVAALFVLTRLRWLMASSRAGSRLHPRSVPAAVAARPACSASSGPHDPGA